MGLPMAGHLLSAGHGLTISTRTKSKAQPLLDRGAKWADSPADAVRYWRLLNEGHECAFGSRFVRGGRVIDYPRVKLLVNRLANLFIRALFAIPLNDTTNAFKAYRRTVIQG